MKITYWTDFSCPFCYIGDTRLKNAIRSLGAEDLVEMDMRSFRLTPQAGPKPHHDMVTGMAKHYGMSLQQAKMKVDYISQLGQAEGLDFRYADVQSCNTFDAHRLSKFAFSKGKEEGERMNLKLFDAFFGKCDLIADHDVLLRLAAECGFDEEEVRNVLETDAFSAEVLADEREAARYNIHAVPFYIIGQYGVPGALSEEEFADVVKEVLIGTGELTEAPNGAVCGPDGCTLPGKKKH